MYQRNDISHRLLFAVLFAFASPTFAGVNTFTEDFTTTTYRDAGATTAWWSFTTGELKLWPNVINEIGTEAVINPLDICIRGPVGYVVRGDNLLQLFELTLPGNPLSIGVVVGFTGAKAVDVRGNHAYVADDSGLRIVDIDAFSIVATYFTAAAAVEVTVAGDLAFVSILSGGLEIVDITNPAAPVFVDIVNTPGLASDAAVSGNYCYVADDASGLQVIDISNPAASSIVASYVPTGSTNGVVIEGNVAYLSNTLSGLVAVDISDPTTPSFLGDIPGVESWSIAIAGNTAYIGRIGDVLQTDISNPSAPSPSNSVGTSGGLPTAIATNAEYVYVADYTNNLVRVMEALEPTPVAEVGSVTPGNVDDLYLEGNVLYTTAGFDMYALDVTDPMNPTVLDTLTLPDLGQDFEVDGDYAYVPGFDQGMFVVDVSDPSAMTHVASLPRFGSDFHGTVAVHGDVAYLGGTGVTDQFHVVDISDPLNPAYGTSLTISQAPDDIFIDGDEAYVAVGYKGLDVVDISNPTSPTFVTNYNTGSDDARNVLVQDNFAYLTVDDQGVHVLNVYDPSTPQLSQILPLSGFFQSGLAITGNYLFTSDDTGLSGGGLRTFDITNPSLVNPVPLGSTFSVSDPRRIVAGGEYVYQAQRFDGVGVVHVLSRDFDLEDNSAYSLPVDGSPDDIYGVNLTAQKAGDAIWLVSADNGNTWYVYPIEGDWFFFPTPASELRWATGLMQTQYGVNPAITQIDITMAFAYPVVNAIEDIPNDQGKQARVTWQFSGLDVSGSPTPILNYAIYRKIDSNLGSVAPANLVAPPENMSALPAGWDFVALIPATGEDEYSIVVPTLADSTLSQGDYNTTFYVRALTATPTTFFDSPPDSGYSVDNLNPGPPANLLVVYNGGGGNDLTWDESDDEDFDYFRVYRSTDPGFVPTPGDLVQSTSGTGWTDTGGAGSDYYKITAVDFSGNESDATGQPNPSGVRNAATHTYALRGAFPNPFNPSTTITYSVPSGGGRVEISVFDAVGRRVRTLVSGNHAPGVHTTNWAGIDNRGTRVSSGVYFYRMTAPGFSATRKMVLLK